jgi:hypothetical protein
MSKLEVDAIEPQSGTTLTIGANGDTVNIASGATITDFTSTGIDDNATSTAITINSSEQVEFTAGTVSLPSISTTGDTNTGIFFPAADTIAFSEGGVERMRIDSAGNVGIGTSAPLAPLMVLTNNPTDDSALRVAVFGLSNVNQGQLEIKSGRDDGSLLGRYSSIQAWSNQLVSPRNLILEPEGGNVGIGTTDPAYPLVVSSDALLVASIICTGATPNAGLDIAKAQDSGDLGNWNALTINGNDNISYESRIRFVFDSISDGSIIAGFRESGSGTQLRFYTTTAEVATEKMRITSAGNVGIGTSSPSNVLHIVSTNATAILQRTTAVGNNSGLSTFDFKNSDSTVSAISNFNKSGSTISTGVDGYEFRLTNHGDGYTSFFNDGSERMRITSAGNVGIGTTAPDAKLSVSEAGADAFTVIKAKNGTVAVDTGAAIELSGFYKAGKIAGTNDNAGTTYAGALRFYTNSNSTNDFVQRMIINSSGNVGIGTSSPGYLLQISASDPVLSLYSSGSNRNTHIYMGDSTDADAGRISYDIAQDKMQFSTNGSLRCTIESSGIVRINNTANATYNAQLNIYSPSTLNCGIHLRTNTGGAQSQIIFGNSNNDSVGSIGTSGTSTSFNTSSDYRIKENVNYNFDATTRLKQLKPARFNFIADANTTVDGFLAHEVQDIVPEAITGSKDATETKEKVVVNANGQVIAENIEQADWETGKIADEDGKSQYPTDSTWEATKVIPVYQAIDQSKLVPLLVKTIQELEARITALETNQP